MRTMLGTGLTDWKCGVPAKRVGAVVLFTLLVCAAANAAAAADGSFDPTWAAGTGRLIFDGDPPLANNDSSVLQIVPQGNGGLLVGGFASTPGTSSSNWFVAEFLSDGTMSPTFGANNAGTVSGCYLAAGLCTSGFSAIVSTADGKIDVADYHSESRLASGGQSLDNASVYGGNGFVVNVPVEINSIHGSFTYTHDITQTSDGKWLLAGYGFYSTATNTDTEFAVIRLNADFSFDTSFHSVEDPFTLWAGGQFVSFGLGGSAAYHILLQPDGRIVLVGTAGSPPAPAIARLNSNGTLDTSFGAGTGKTILNWSLGTMVGSGRAKFDGQGRLLVAGYAILTGATTTGMAVARFLADGTLDTTFGSNGVSDYLPAICPFGAAASALAFDSAGRIVVAGYCETSVHEVFLLERLYGDNGGIDATFGSSGFSDGQFSATSDFDIAYDVAFDSSGHPVFAGQSAQSGVYRAGIARLTYDLIYTNNFETSPAGRLSGQ